jgi:hypothetical protein
MASGRKSLLISQIIISYFRRFFAAMRQRENLLADAAI